MLRYNNPANSLEVGGLVFSILMRILVSRSRIEKGPPSEVAHIAEQRVALYDRGAEYPRQPPWHWWFRRGRLTLLANPPASVLMRLYIIYLGSYEIIKCQLRYLPENTCSTCWKVNRPRFHGFELKIRSLNPYGQDEYWATF